jgi:hypothetical protein
MAEVSWKAFMHLVDLGDLVLVVGLASAELVGNRVPGEALGAGP